MAKPRLTWQESFNPRINIKNIKTPGRWMSYLAINYADSVWKKIDTGTKKGELGYRSKISSPIFSLDNKRAYCVLYVYTYDCHNQDDILRVREELKNLGFVRPINYTTKNLFII